MSITVLQRIFRKKLTDALAGKLEIIKVMAVREYILHLTEVNSNGYDNIFSQNFEMVSSRTSHIMLSRMRFSFGHLVLIVVRVVHRHREFFKRVLSYESNIDGRLLPLHLDYPDNMYLPRLSN